ncbi:NADH-quinone oxidoreductase subunit K [Roseococcus thiosulfatophilus]|uniref:NADH-quinone oxidoreductase subunit K n=1 Tax=Roseococcus thiosulfatophilus TaxID=35813 RepID=UPI001A8F10FA|nr:NADH-quinone oxidoreductase subunit K [Roseococcus thiosulfatophilus]
MIPSATLFGLAGAALVGIGLYGFLAHAHLLRRLLSFNVLGSGVFLMFGAAAWRSPWIGADAVPHALIITGIVVKLAGSALAIALLVQLARATRRAALPEDEGRPP